MSLRRRIPAEEFLRDLERKGFDAVEKKYESEEFEITESDKKKLKEISDGIKKSEKAVLLGRNLEELKSISSKSLSSTLRRMNEKPYVLVMDGTVTKAVLNSSEEAGIRAIVASNFASTDTGIQLLSL